jgi:hypothetical protein
MIWQIFPFFLKSPKFRDLCLSINQTLSPWMQKKPLGVSFNLLHSPPGFDSMYEEAESREERGETEGYV